jgi:fructose-1,6-bisphosphatase/inositol monophosphatase family enzyme
MEAAAKAAGDLIKAGFRNHGVHRFKGPKDLVTDIDTAAERSISKALAAEFPDVGFLGEETGRTAGTSGFEWVVDPLDGTRNFVIGIPIFCVSVALVERARPVAGVIFDPVHNELFGAVKGHGLQVNGKVVEVVRPTRLADTVLGYDLSRDSMKAAAMLEVLARIEPMAQSVRGLGSTALGLAYAGCGRLDMYLSWGGAWDVAAGLVIASESGAKVTDRFGGEATVDAGSYIVAAESVATEFIMATEGLKFRT